LTTQLTLQPESSAARIARRWVREELTDRQRDDLLESAVLGVSELVTNALLHVRSTINVRIVDRDERLRIEVHDDSTRPPDGRANTATSPTTPATFGRGLQIVDSISLSWGVAYEDAGKVVWFHPMPEGSHRRGRHVNLPRPMVDVAVTAGVETAPCELIDVPVIVLEHVRLRFQDLRRELTLVALHAHDKKSGQSGVVGRLNEVALRLEHFRGVSAGAEKAIDAAIDAGLDRVTLHYDLPLSAVPGILELQQLIHEADEFCRAQQLLTLASGPQESALRDWYLGELVAQAQGTAPTPWPGEFVVTDPRPLG
jgi:anti-sigma regulatory factor (Ser/Thr protein kinase)